MELSFLIPIFGVLGSPLIGVFIISALVLNLSFCVKNKNDLLHLLNFILGSNICLLFFNFRPKVPRQNILKFLLTTDIKCFSNNI